MHGEQEEGAGEQQQQPPKQEAEENDEEEQEDDDVDPGLLTAAIALSLAPPDEEQEQQEEQLPPPPLKEFLELRTPESLLCPITLHLLDDPVVLFADGCTYSRAAIEEHLAFCRKSKWSGWVVEIGLCVSNDELIDLPHTDTTKKTPYRGQAADVAQHQPRDQH